MNLEEFVKESLAQVFRAVQGMSEEATARAAPDHDPRRYLQGRPAALGGIDAPLADVDLTRGLLTAQAAYAKSGKTRTVPLKPAATPRVDPPE